MEIMKNYEEYKLLWKVWKKIWKLWESIKNMKKLNKNKSREIWKIIKIGEFWK